MARWPNSIGCPDCRRCKTCGGTGLRPGTWKAAADVKKGDILILVKGKPLRRAAVAFTDAAPLTKTGEGGVEPVRIRLVDPDPDPLTLSAVDMVYVADE